MSPSIPPAQAVAAGAAIIPPSPASAPLGTTLQDIDGTVYAQSSPHHNVESAEEDRKSEKDLSANHPSSLPSSSQLHVPARQFSSARLIGIASVATCTMIMSSMGNIVLTIALPTIKVDLDMEETDLQWLSSAYSLTYGCFLLLAGRLADIHGRKLVFLCGVSWYAIWTLIGPFFNDGAGLVVSRALAGCGSSMA